MPESIAPSSRPPPTSGGTIYVVVAVALLFAIIGLVYWKLKGSDTPATAAPLPVATTAGPLAEPPPPPPPIEEPTAAVDAARRASPPPTTARAGSPSAAVASTRPCPLRCPRAPDLRDLATNVRSG